ncbi:CHASE3 domain-containing protein [Flavobacterium cellulosilyticum]|uniref:histidine kinase n=1 Tax=Flavobacterium cellulosilyticum TaxID=2541731 RepID=A0A4R5CBJ1_9FLAO|nr:CHASE3 domain-containing protein [Flavobacterium cellulosilyticum]TDD96136.1 histidine kinase [Flavobacterium cellulosilyticum]
MKNLKLKSTFYHKIIFAISLLILLVVGVITIKHINSISASSKLLMHTYEVNLELEHLYSYIKDSENSIRGYLISRDTVYLKPYRDDIKQVNKSFELLQELTKDSPKQQKNLDFLYKIINTRNLYMSSYSNFNNNFDVTQNITFKKNFNESGLLLAAIRIKLNEMVTIEESFLKQRNFNYNSQIYLTPILTLSILFLTLLLLVFAYYQTTKDVEKLQAYNFKLNKSHFLSYQAEILSEFGTWDLNLNTNTIVCSDNLYRILGVAPQSFQASQKNFLKFIHPEDIPFVTRIFDKIVADENLPNSYFRIIKPDGAVRLVRSVGKLFVDQLGNRTILGVTSDITNERRKTELLEERNQELEQRIKELNEFNHVASHDLQEPLRKIQTFISRINEKEKENLSNFGIEYLSRIENAANRMRTLINDLLQYSRTSRPEKNLEITDLNEILNDSLTELSQNIENKKAIINHEILPTIEAIPFQMQQLFSNMLSNSLKYSKLTSTPVIDINYTEITAKNEPHLVEYGQKKYHKITFTDNGIGFNQEHADKIFLLFNRLHGKSEYNGTGVGLAICKKIAENHKGFIFADSKLDEGSTFTVFIPV